MKQEQKTHLFHKLRGIVSNRIHPKKKIWDKLKELEGRIAKLELANYSFRQF